MAKTFGKTHTYAVKYAKVARRENKNAEKISKEIGANKKTLKTMNLNPTITGRVL